MRTIKRQTMYALAVGRRWANTAKGERIIVQTMTSMTVLCAIFAILLIVG